MKSGNADDVLHTNSVTASMRNAWWWIAGGAEERCVRQACWWLFAGAVQVSHTKARRREEEKRPGFRPGPFASPRLRVRPVDR